MKEIGFEELKELQLSIMSEIHEFCTRHNLKYFLAYGTLIGAIRHKGYIPWDDDIDIFMPRPDYIKFINTFNNEESCLRVVSPELYNDYYASYANVYDKRTLLIEESKNHRFKELGVKIDIFPLDGVNDDKMSNKTQKIRCRVCGSILREKNTSVVQAFRNGIIRGVMNLTIKTLSLCMPYKWVHRQLISVASKYDYNKCNYVDNVVTGIFEHRKPKYLFNKPVLWPFEKYEFYVPEGYDEYLRDRYGDYMKLPPVDQQIPHHGFNAYWK